MVFYVEKTIFVVWVVFIFGFGYLENLKPDPAVVVNVDLVIFLMGSLCRLNSKFLPLLYNHRNMGVSMFLLAFFHGALPAGTY